ncbi:MAG TPA: molybdopterin dinucleotide binding domain-containing protein, partial [Methylococcaceae bacterium]|nr:molybdopterin dinucleotide binding domain-containing protein [Methylococcaceae bacterium]
RRAGARDGETVRLSTRRGSVEVQLKITERSPEGIVFLPFHFVEAAANRLTSSKMDPASKTPGFKSSAARIERIAATGKGNGAASRSMAQWHSQQSW